MRKSRQPAADYNLAAAGGAGPLFPDRPLAPKVQARDPDAPARPKKVVTVIVAGDDPNALIGLTEADARLVKELSVTTGPTSLYRLILGARSAGYAILIRSDLPDLV